MAEPKAANERSLSDGGEQLLRLRAAGCVNPEGESALIRRRFPRIADQWAAIDKRTTGTPLEVVLGEAEFAGVTVDVRPDVFIPRPRAECLVLAADDVARTLEATSGNLRPLRALDLGCGTGAIAAAFRRRHPDWQVHASDADPAAVRCAAANGSRFGFVVHHSDWFRDLPANLRHGIDLVVAHLPYVPTGELSLLPRDYRSAEPAASVDGGQDGLVPWRQVLAAYDEWLAPRGALLTLVAEHQTSRALSAARGAGLMASTVGYADAVVVLGQRR